MRHTSTIPHPTIAADEGRSLSRGLLRLADPKIGLASFVPFCVGITLAWYQGVAVRLWLAAAAFLALFLVEVGKNAVNDLYDFRSGADSAVLPEERSPFSGGKRVLVDALLTEHDLVAIAWIAFACAAAVGSAVAISSVPALFALGGAAALVSIAYSAPPLHLSYRGLGELAVGAVYGPGIVLGSLLLLSASLTRLSVEVATVLGVLIALVLIANEIPDERADRTAGKRTLVVRLGRRRTYGLIATLFGLAFIIPLGATAYAGLSPLTGALAGAPVAAFACAAFDRERVRPPVVAQASTLLTYVITGAGMIAAAIALR